MLPERVSREDISDIRVEYPGVCEVRDLSGGFEGWVELQQWFGPEFTFTELVVDGAADLVVINADE